VQPSTLEAVTSVTFNRFTVDLAAETVTHEEARAEDLEDALGGIARATKLLSGITVVDPYDPAAPLIMNLGLLSGTRVMTGLRTFFHGYSPLKVSDGGSAGLMWTAGSGHFGTKLRGLGVDEVVFTGRAARPTLLHLVPGDGDGPARFVFLDASHLSGKRINDRIQGLHVDYPNAHFAVIGPAAEHYETVRFASIALSTDNQLESGDPKARFCGRGGYGGVMASKNLWGIIADGPDPGRIRGLKDVNREISTGPGSARYRDLEHDRGGTWRMVPLLGPENMLPETNYSPSGTDRPMVLGRAAVEDGPYEVRAEGCYLCGIRCHKNVYEAGSGDFRSKVDYEPLALLSLNLGIYDPDVAFSLIELVDELGMDAITLGVTLGYVMEHNRRTDAGLVGGLSFGDAEGVRAAIEAVAAGRLPDVGQGTKRLADLTGGSAYAMQSKGVEFPAYLPHTNPGYPWALAGGHMAMRTYLLYVSERQTDVDYWVDVITKSGPMILMDDITGLCKFAGLSPEMEAEAARIAVGLDIDGDALADAVLRTFLRGYANERRTGFTVDDYRLPAEAHGPMGESGNAVFNTPAFFEEVRSRVIDRLDRGVAEAGFVAS
jgi:aldehyde:ferredoxin oxidoreductase